MAPSWQCLPWSLEQATRAELGRRAERAAERFLVQRGLRTIVRNYRTRVGEIDLVMTHEGETVFVEVRYRTRSDFGDGAATVDYNKQKRLVRAARHYLRRHADDVPCRFDVVSVTRTHYRLRFEWIRSAFTP